MNIAVSIDFASPTNRLSRTRSPDAKVRVTLRIGIASIVDTPESHLLTDPVEQTAARITYEGIISIWISTVITKSQVARTPRGRPRQAPFCVGIITVIRDWIANRRVSLSRNSQIAVGTTQFRKQIFARMTKYRVQNRTLGEILRTIVQRSVTIALVDARNATDERIITIGANRGIGMTYFSAGQTCCWKTG